MNEGSTGVPLVGRDDELRRLGALLAGAVAGWGSVALVSGEAGIGKTRLCDELAAAHRELGGRVLLGAAFPEDVEVPFGPIVDAIRADRRGESAFWEAARSRADLLHAVAPELAREAGEGRPGDRGLLFEALLDAVAESAGGRTT